jgi:hypothetical protein
MMPARRELLLRKINGEDAGKWPALYAHLGTFFLIADATRHHACAALPTPAFIRDQNLIAVTMTCMAV